MILDVNSPLANGYLDRTAPWTTYTNAYYQQVFGVIEAFKSFDNVLGFFAGNEVINEDAARLARIGHLYREGAAAPATLRALRTDVRRWTTWCRAERRGPLPARPADLAAFVLAHRTRWTPATLRRAASRQSPRKRR